MLCGKHVTFSAVKHVFPAEPEDAIDEEISRRQALVRDLESALNTELFVVNLVDFTNLLL